jgi:hypothetical protein
VIVKLLLENGADINAQEGLFSNALHATSPWGQKNALLQSMSICYQEVNF